MKRKHTAYTQVDLDKWRDDMRAMQPGGFIAPALIRTLSPLSFSPGTTPTGMILRMVDGHDGQPVTIHLNPVVAAALRDAILACGVDGGWLQQNGQITAPTHGR